MITNKHPIFEYEKSMIILFKQTSINSINFKKEGDFIFIFNSKELIGINVFNYKKYFSSIENGFHSLNDEVKQYLIKEYKQYVEVGNFNSLIKVGKVVDKKTHPNSDKLFVLKVDFKDNKLQIITNLKDVNINQNYLFALDGATLANGTKIKESKVLNILSQGMIVSYKSLGLDKEGVVDCTNYSLDDDFIF